jgi:hypothetical protein
MHLWARSGQDTRPWASVGRWQAGPATQTLLYISIIFEIQNEDLPYVEKYSNFAGR